MIREWLGAFADSLGNNLFALRFDVRDAEAVFEHVLVPSKDATVGIPLWQDIEGRIYVRLLYFHQFLTASSPSGLGLRYTRSRLTADLQAVGFESDQVQSRRGGDKRSARYMRSEPNYLEGGEHGDTVPTTPGCGVAS